MIDKAAEKISIYNRLRKFNLFIEYFRPTPATTILDVGPAEREYQEGDNLLEKRYPFPDMITALGIEDFKEFYKRYPKVKVVRYGGGGFPFEDGQFDICWSNAVLEHVKPGEDRERFLREIRRVAKAAFITTPNRYFPFEVHTKIFILHWLPKKVFDRILVILNKGWASGEYMKLMGKKEIIDLLERCDITNYKILRNKMLGFILDFVVIF